MKDAGLLLKDSLSKEEEGGPNPPGNDPIIRAGWRNLFIGSNFTEKAG